MLVQDFKKVKGDDVDLNLAFTDSNGDAQDITDWTIRLMLKTNISDTDEQAVVNVDATITDGSSGLATITIPNTTTDDLEGTYYYEIKYLDSNDKIKTILSGKFVFKKRIILSMD